MPTQLRDSQVAAAYALYGWSLDLAPGVMQVPVQMPLLHPASLSQHARSSDCLEISVLQTKVSFVIVAAPTQMHATIVGALFASAVQHHVPCVAETRQVENEEQQVDAQLVLGIAHQQLCALLACKSPVQKRKVLEERVLIAFA